MSRGLGCGQIAVLGFGALVLFSIFGGSEPDQPPANFTADQLKACRSVIAAAEKAGVIRERPRGDRVNVEDRRWANLPATEKRAIAYAVGCDVYERPLKDMEASMVYGYRSGRHLGGATAYGIVLK